MWGMKNHNRYESKEVGCFVDGLFNQFNQAQNKQQNKQNASGVKINH